MAELTQSLSITLDNVGKEHLDDVVITPAASEEAEFFSRKGDLKLRGILQDIEERKKYANYFFRLACSWLFIITTILILQGFDGFYSFKLQDNIVLAVIGSTTVNILGILYVVANYLFPKR